MEACAMTSLTACSTAARRLVRSAFAGLRVRAKPRALPSLGDAIADFNTLHLDTVVHIATHRAAVLFDADRAEIEFPRGQDGRRRMVCGDRTGICHDGPPSDSPQP